MADAFDTVTALDDLHSKAVKKAAGIEERKKVEDTGVDHETALDEVETEMHKLREKGRDLMKKKLQNSPEYEELVTRSKHLRRKQRFLQESAQD